MNNIPSIPINTLEIVFPPKYATGFKYTINNLIPSTSASFVCTLVDTNNNVIDMKMIEISGPDYLAWGSDDSYLTKILAQKLGATLSS